MQLLADEGFNGFIVRSLREAGFSVEWVLEGHSGVTDEAVIKLAKENQQILLTEDKDFGEWIFAHQILEQIQHLNTLIDFQKENRADASTVRQYEFMRKKFVEELNEIFLLFGITVQPMDTAA